MSTISKQNIENNFNTPSAGQSLSGHEIVISGISGLFPSSENVKEFMDNLYNKVDMVVPAEFMCDFGDMPRYQGKASGYDKFDAQFFKVRFQQAAAMDSMTRKLLEHVYSAIYDAGINPLEFKGKKVGVFIGTQWVDSFEVIAYAKDDISSFIATGSSKSMAANRISYWLDGIGPSYATELACASSLGSLEHAYRYIKAGLCDAAVVGGSNICMSQGPFINLQRAGFLSVDGKTKCFNKDGDGYVRSDAVNVLFLQKRRDAKRIYSEVCYVKLGYNLREGDKFTLNRRPNELIKFFENFYNDIDVSSEEIEYVEANASGIAEADGNEVEAIGSFFGKNSPIKIGSVKSNMGHSEPVSGLSALTKVCLAYHTGKLPGNLHYTEPQDISSIREGKVVIVQDNIPFMRGVTAINNFSYTGIDGHVLLKGHYKAKDKNCYLTTIPYLITVSGRNEHCVNEVLENMESRPVDAELIALLHNIYQTNTTNHTSRGYVILGKNGDGETVSMNKSISHYPGTPRTVCFLYSGMGSQWIGMGADLMQIPIFNNAIMRCHKVLQQKGVDIIKIITDTNKNVFDNALHSFIGITAIQIGLTDILKEIGIVPDILIGHSLGEIGCAYADGCFTTEETILTSYCRGSVSASIKTKSVPGAMAAIGLGYKDIADLLPPEIDIACHNSSESSTISGPAEDVGRFVEKIKCHGIFAKEVPTNGISYHSRYIAAAGPMLLTELKEVIKNPKPRSEKWLCTSMPREKWNYQIAKYCSAEYHVNNLLSPVYFDETFKLIPHNAVIIEIAPHGLLQSILNKPDAKYINIALTKRGISDSVKFLLEAIGVLYEIGLNPRVAELYPKVEFPVSTETPLLSDFVRWDHTETWPLVYRTVEKEITPGFREFFVSTHDEEYSFIKHHVRNGFNVFPESALLVLVWETLAKSLGTNYRSLSVIFSNVIFQGEVIINPDDVSKLTVLITQVGNKFEVFYEGMSIVVGLIRHNKNVVPNTRKDNIPKSDLTMCSQDLYKTLHLRGYSYKHEFQSICSASIDCKTATVKWTNNWITFIDALMQLNVLANGTNGTLRPKLIQELKIDVLEHQKELLNKHEDFACLNADVVNIYGTTRCGGIELKDIVFQNIPIRQQYPDILNNKICYSYFPANNCDLETALNIHLQIITENNIKENIMILELNPSFDISLSNCIKKVAKNIAMNADIHCVQVNKKEKYSYIEKGDVVLVYDLFQDMQEMITIRNRLQSETFVLALERSSDIRIILEKKTFTIISSIRISKTNVLLLMKKCDDYVIHGGISYIEIDSDYSLSCLKHISSNLSSKKEVILLAVNKPYNGITGIIKMLNREYDNKVRSIIINDINAPVFHQDNIFYKEQLQKQLAVNILQKGQWGGFYRIPNMQCPEIKHYELSIDVPADFNSFKWCENASIQSFSRKVQIHYAGITLKDVNKAIETSITNEERFGMDFSGIDDNGNRVMGLTAGGAIANTVIVHDTDLLWPVPEHWTMKEAATVPLAFVHAYYCLSMRATLNKGVSVIITGGAGALGQAVISICLKNGHNIYTTVRNIEKKKFLLQMFPELNENQIYSSMDEHFASFIKSNTKNEQLNVVVNCSSGKIRQGLMTCVGPKGYFLDVSKYDVKKNVSFGMNFLIKAKNYIAVDLSNIFNSENIIQRKRLELMVCEGIVKGEVRPLGCFEYTSHEIPRAFKMLSTNKHSGRALINLQYSIPADLRKISLRITCSSENSYIIVCDKSELGLDVIDLLIRRGARKVVIHLKKGVSGYGVSKLTSWNKQNVNVKLVYHNIKTKEGCSNVFNEAIKMGPIEGIFIILNHAENNKNNHYTKDFAGSYNIATSDIINLEATSRYFTIDILRYFAIITQSSKNIFDEYINSIAEEICRARNAVGLSGLVFRAEFFDQFSFLFENINPKIKPQNITALNRGLETSLRLKLNNVQTYNLMYQISEELPINQSTLSDTTVFSDMSVVLPEDIPDTKVNIHNKTSLLNKCISNDYKNTVRPKTNFYGGLEAFYTFADHDDYRATDPFISMLTKVANRFAETGEVDPNAEHLMLIPGFEGHHKIFNFLCLRLKMKAFTIQLDPDMKNSIHEIARDIIKLLKKKKVLIKDKFYLLGYSFGINVALELTSMLEKEGRVGTVFCLDSSPDVLRVQLDSYIGELSDLQLQDYVMKHMLKLVTRNKVTEFNKDIKCISDWSQKIDLFIQQVKGNVGYPHQYIKYLLNSAYNRIILARGYNPTFSLISQLILIKGIPHPDSKCLPHDYNLSKYSNNPIQIFEIESDTALAPYDCRINNIINKILVPGLRQEF